MKPLFKDTLKIVNVGLAGFGDNVVAAGGECVALTWQPPAQGDRDAAWALAQVLGHETIEQANKIAFARFLEANKEFHVAIAQASGNARLAHAIAQLLDEMTRLLHLGLGFRF